MTVRQRAEWVLTCDGDCGQGLHGFGRPEEAESWAANNGWRRVGPGGGQHLCDKCAGPRVEGGSKDDRRRHLKVVEQDQ